MCGIAGFVWRDVNRPANVAAVQAMCDIQAHRGPDDQGIYASGPVGLGQRRLSILDLSPAGHQPMPSRDGKLVIIFNGEIYNYVELAEELRGLGASFKSGSDTEVILEAYRHWGKDCVSRFNGMWALAIHDVEAQTVFFSRDRLGIKPLYYHLSNQALFFASEIKALLAVQADLREVNQPYLARFLTTGIFDDGEETCFRQVRQLLPAHNAELNLRTGAFRTWRYWDVPVGQEWSPSDGDPIEYLASLLDSAIRLHSRSDVPLGTCLSGGIDSSTIVALMSGHSPFPVKTFSGLYRDRLCDERRYVDLVNQATRAEAHPVTPEPNGNLLEDLTRITWHQDEPTGGPGLYTQYHVMRRASQNVKVILDGQGGDELFGGYLYYFYPFIRDLIGQGVGGWATAIGTALAMRRHWGAKIANPAFDLVTRGMAGRIRRRIVRNKPSAMAFLHPALLQQATTSPITREVRRPFRTNLDNDLYDQTTRTSIPALLHYEDRNSMAYSIEARVPLLDYRVVEFAFRLGITTKIHGTWTKWPLRQIASRVLPGEVAWRRSKMGYPTPMSRWFRAMPDQGHIRDVLFSSSLAQREIVSGAGVERLWNEHQNGADHSWAIYRVVTTELWYRHFIDRLAPMPAVPVPAKTVASAN